MATAQLYTGGYMATLVTGGTGFIGSNIVKALALQRHEVVSYMEDMVAPPDVNAHCEVAGSSSGRGRSR